MRSHLAPSFWIFSKGHSKILLLDFKSKHDNVTLCSRSCQISLHYQYKYNSKPHKPKKEYHNQFRFFALTALTKYQLNRHETGSADFSKKLIQSCVPATPVLCSRYWLLQYCVPATPVLCSRYSSTVFPLLQYCVPATPVLGPRYSSTMFPLLQ